MTALEDLLRESLNEKATLSRLTDDVAGAAIRGARTVKRRRIALVAGTLAVAIVAAVSAVSLSGPTALPIQPANPTTTPPPTTQPSTMDKYGVHVDVLDPSNVLHTPDGQEYDLGTGKGMGVVRVPVGWLYGTPRHDVSLLRPDGTSIFLTGVHADEAGFEQPGVPVLSADGRQIAWVSGSVLHAAGLSADGVVDVRISPVPANSFAATWIGSRVVVGNSYATGCCGFNKARYDVWDPTDGNFVPHWTKDMYPVYGPVPSGTAPYANVAGTSGTEGCLGRVDGVRSMAIVDKVCPLGLAYQSTMGLLSPDGLHLAELDNRGNGDTLIIIDLRRVTVVGRCFADQPLVWENDGTLLAERNVSASGGLQRCDIVTGTTTAVDRSYSETFHLVRLYGV